MPYECPTLGRMRKTSVYLPEETKAALHHVAERWQRSEAELIRLAVERLVHSAENGSGPSATAQPTGLDGPVLIGVGVGPSAPDLVTERAVDTLQRADQVFAASTAPDAIGRAEAIVRSVAPEVAVDRLAVSIGGDAGERSASLDRAAQTIVAKLDAGASVAFVTLGDPNVYSVFSSIQRRVAAERPRVPIEVVPGVMAFQELAARCHTVLSEGSESIEVVTVGDDPSVLDGPLGRDTCTVVVYKGGRHLPEVADRLKTTGRLEGAAVGELLGVPGNRSNAVAEVADRPASYLATVVVPAKRSAGGPGENHETLTTAGMEK